VRLAAVLLLLAGCSFAPGVPPSGGGAIDASGGGGSGSGSGSGMCPDADGDGVCDAQDVCPGSDDHADADADGVPDGCDDWPCGVKPQAPPSSPSHTTFGSSWRASSVDVGGGGALAVVPAGQAFTLGFNYTLSVGCFANTSCRIQLEMGTDVEGKTGCAYDGTVIGSRFGVGSAAGTYSGNATLSTAGRHDLRLAVARDGSCSASWSNGTPGGSSTIAIVCVH